MTVYPAKFPLPDRQPYSLAVDAGLLRSQFSTGNSRQRRQYTRLPTIMALQFTLRAEELTEWQSWCNDNAWTWFQIDLQSALSKGEILSPHEVRFITSLDISSAGWNLVTVTVGAEMSPAMLANAFIPADPPTPPSSGPYWIVAGTPSNPAVTVTDPGTVSNPSVEV
jgi:hypothetical protein